MRTILTVSLAFVAACTVGEAGPPGGGQSIDAPTGGGGQDAGSAGGGQDAAIAGDGGIATDGGSAAFACRPKVTAGLGNGHHNPGMDCMDACHNHGFTAAGTLYTSTAGTTAIAGGTITVVGANGVSVDIVSQTNGNFYTSAALTFPIKITASECPSIAPMSATVPAGSGGCNKVGCHASAAGQGRVHLP